MSMDHRQLHRKIVELNRRVFPCRPPASGKKPIVLFELNTMHSAHIAYSYLANVLADEFQAEIFAYGQRPHLGFLRKLRFRFRAYRGSNEFGVFKSFGVSTFIAIELNTSLKTRAARLFDAVYGQLATKLDVENLTIHGVWIGDLVYDSFLMHCRKPTIDLQSEEFRRSLRESLETFVFWEDFFAGNDVRAVNVSHCVYNLAIPLRIALKNNIPAFQANATHVYRLRPNNMFAYNDFIYYPERFATLPPEVRAAGIEEARRRIERRFSGEVGVDMPYSSKSAYGQGRHDRLLRESSRKKVLIATHCFFDSPHGYGNNIFPDFYEWLDFLGRITEETEYDWYIKTHPDYLPGTMEIIRSFIAKYPRFILLPADASHHQIIAEGIDFALTVFGTIGFEYAALGIPVINASQNNPHIAYNFNLHAKDAEDYRRLVLGMGDMEFCIDRQQVYEYYFMRHIFNTENLFFSELPSSAAGNDVYLNQFTPAIYDNWLKEWSPEKHSSIILAIKRFLDSNDFRMDYRHDDRDFFGDLQ